MAPFRASRSTRSGRPAGQNDHDYTDGLPVRQWRLNESMVDTTEDLNALSSTTKQEQTIWKELPMPKGSDHYAPWCQQMLKMSRAGRINQSQQGIGADVGQRNENGADGPATGVDTFVVNGTRNDSNVGMKRGFMATRWSQISKHAEEHEPEYLAKRRKGLPSQYSGLPAAGGAQTGTTRMRKTKVKRVDQDGHTLVWEVLVQEGHTIEGEITESITLETAGAAVSAPAPGTVVEGLGIANEEGIVIAGDATTAPIKRKGPPPRKKKRGPGRGKKKLAFTEGEGVSASSEALADLENGQNRANGNRDASRSLREDEQGDGQNGDDDDDEGEDDDGDGDEVDDDDEDEEREEGELSESPRPEQLVPEQITKLAVQDHTNDGSERSDQTQPAELTPAAESDAQQGGENEMKLDTPDIEPGLSVSHETEPTTLPTTRSPNPTISITDESSHLQDAKTEETTAEIVPAPDDVGPEQLPDEPAPTEQSSNTVEEDDNPGLGTGVVEATIENVVQDNNGHVEALASPKSEQPNSEDILPE